MIRRSQVCRTNSVVRRYKVLRAKLCKELVGKERWLADTLIVQQAEAAVERRVDAARSPQRCR